MNATETIFRRPAAVVAPLAVSPLHRRGLELDGWIALLRLVDRVSAPSPIPFLILYLSGRNLRSGLG